jgi:diguanylate cyclase (GGDEF)-like protein/PAS domain S-box-containing protein
LQESETRYRELIELAVDGILISSHEEIIIGANSRMLNLTGRTLDKLVGKHIGVLFNPSELKSSPFRFDLLQKGETVRNERNLIRPDGSFVPVEMHTKMMPDGTYQSIYHDITDRKQAEEILKESEWRTRIVSELTTDYIFVVDVDPGGILKFRWASDNLFRITGRTVEEVATSDKWGSIIHPDDRVRFFDFVKQILSTASAGEFECRTFYKHGGERWIRIFARPQVGEGNKVRTIVGAIQDITERKRAEKALRESQELFSLFMHHSPIHAYIKEVTPTESRVVQASDNYEQMIGVRGRDMMDKTMEELFPAEFAAKITADDWSVVASGEVLKLDEDLNGRHYTTIKFPLVQGDKTLLAGYTIDITERKLAEVELQYMKEGLETANAELHIALARQQQLAHTDSLTGINNRRYLYELAEYEFGIAIRYQQPFSVIMFDLDHFKEVNDTFGHAAGDQILQLVAKTACAELRSADVIGRYGGEEFVIVLPMTNAQQAHPLAERIRMGVAAIRVPTEIGDAAVTLSIGIVEMSHGRQTESVEDLIRRADKVMYAAKQAGRNRTEIGD